MSNKTLQQIVTPLVTALLEKRYQFTLTHRKPGAPKVKFPKSLTFNSLAKKYKISPRTLNRWYSGETKTTKKSVTKIKRDSQKQVKSSRDKLKAAGKEVHKAARKIFTHVERLKFAHGKPTWRVHTIGWTHQDLTDFIYSISLDKDYEFMLTIWNPQLYPDNEKSGGFISSGWTSTRGRFTKNILHKWILREQLSRGEIHAIIFTKNK